MLISGVVRGLWLEVGTVALVALVVWAWNTFLLPTIGASIALQQTALFLGPLRLPEFPFRISSQALGLLLVFRTNTCYARWKDAGQAWTRLVEHCKSLTRMGLTYLAKEDREEFARRVAAVPRCAQYYLRGGAGERETRDKALRSLLGTGEVRRIGGGGREAAVSLAVMDVTMVVKRNELESSTRASFDKHLDGLTSSVLFCGRLLKTPIPLVYTRHTSRFLALWMLLLPFALYDLFTPHWLIVPVAAMLAVAFFGIEELGIQIEEPFSILPLEEFCDNLESDLRRMSQYERASSAEPPRLDADREAWI